MHLPLLHLRLKDVPLGVCKYAQVCGAPKTRQSLALDRKQALATVLQMTIDFDSYNDNNEFGIRLEPLDLDFNRDIEEMRLPAQYDADPHGDSEDDE
jgi:hypothetical protein